MEIIQEELLFLFFVMNTAQLVLTENFKIQSMIRHIETNHWIFGTFLRIPVAKQVKGIQC